MGSSFLRPNALCTHFVHTVTDQTESIRINRGPCGLKPLGFSERSSCFVIVSLPSLVRGRRFKSSLTYQNMNRISGCRLDGQIHPYFHVEANLCVRGGL